MVQAVFSSEGEITHIAGRCHDRLIIVDVVQPIIRTSKNYGNPCGSAAALRFGNRSAAGEIIMSCVAFCEQFSGSSIIQPVADVFQLLVNVLDCAATDKDCGFDSSDGRDFNGRKHSSAIGKLFALEIREDVVFPAQNLAMPKGRKMNISENHANTPCAVRPLTVCRVFFAILWLTGFVTFSPTFSLSM